MHAHHTGSRLLKILICHIVQDPNKILNSVTNRAMPFVRPYQITQRRSSAIKGNDLFNYATFFFHQSLRCRKRARINTHVLQSEGSCPLARFVSPASSDAAFLPVGFRRASWPRSRFEQRPQSEISHTTRTGCLRSPVTRARHITPSKIADLRSRPKIHDRDGKIVPLILITS